MGKARTSFHALLLLLLASLIPALFLLDFLVQEAGRASWLESALQIRLDGQEALTLGAPALEVEGARPGLHLDADGPLRADAFPWEPTPFAGHLTLRLDPELLADPGVRPREEGFAASYSVRLLERADGRGLPPIPCVGRVLVGERSARVEPPRELGDFDALQLTLDLICTSAGPDLAWNSGDERTWTIEGSLRLRTGKMPS